MDKNHKRLPEPIQKLFTANSFDLFLDGVEMEVLDEALAIQQDKASSGEEEAMRELVEAREKLEAAINKLALRLKDRLLVLGMDRELPEKILGEFPLKVQYRVLGEQQFGLLQAVGQRISDGKHTLGFTRKDTTKFKSPPGKIRMFRIMRRIRRMVRAKVAELKEAMGMPNEAESKLLQLKCIRSKLARVIRNGAHKKRKTNMVSLLATAARELPVKILLVAVRNADYDASCQAELVPILKTLFTSLPSHAFVRTLVREMGDILRVTPPRFHAEIRVFRDFVRAEHAKFLATR
jgi:hypothetical protein